MSQDVPGSSPLRVALVTGNLNLGGTTTFLCNLGGELVRRRIPVRVLSLEQDNPLAPDFQRLKIPVQSLDDRRVIYEDRLATVLDELRRFQPAVVLANLSPSSFEVLRYIPVGVLRVGTGQSDDPGVYETLRHYAPWMDLLAVVSRTMKTKAEAMPEFKSLPVHCLPYGVPVPQHPPGNVRTEGPLRILFLGRLWHEQKRVRFFPVIFDRLKASGIPFHWTVAGEGPEKEFLEQTMRGTATQTASFPGKFLYGDVPRLLAEHDIFLLASDYEGLPLSLLEAMGQGLVPVVSDLPSGIPDVVDATTGKLVPPDNVDGYADAIIWLHQHRDELRCYSERAQEKVRRDFSVGAMADRWLKVLPEAARPDVAWPTTWDIKPPLLTRHPVYFSPPLRVLRRLAIKFRRHIRRV